MAEVLQINPPLNQVETSNGNLSYDFLVLACGSQANFRRNTQLAKYTLPLKTIQHALAIRSWLLENGERALELNDKKQQVEQLNVIIVGGGPTWVERAGAIAELRDLISVKDYPDLPIRQMQIHLMEANERLLHTMGKESSHKAYEYLSRMGISIHLKKKVQSFDGSLLILTDGAHYQFKTVFCTAGVEGISIPGLGKASIGASNRYLVNEFNQVNGYENVFGIGDKALQILPDSPLGHPSNTKLTYAGFCLGFVDGRPLVAPGRFS